MWCRHKFGKVESGYQTCNKCGKTIPVDCNHKWEILETATLWRDPGKVTIGKMYVLQCSHCGDLMKKKFDIREDF